MTISLTKDQYNRINECMKSLSFNRHCGKVEKDSIIRQIAKRGEKDLFCQAWREIELKRSKRSKRNKLYQLLENGLNLFVKRNYANYLAMNFQILKELVVAL
jgi:hypothetical protein